jgi:hypothetical protein
MRSSDTRLHHMMRLFLVRYGGCMILLHGLLIMLDLWDVDHGNDLVLKRIRKNIQTRIQRDASSETT